MSTGGLADDPWDNLLTACPDDFAAVCRSIAEQPDAELCVVTGFYIAHAAPPGGETDGPLGAVFLARALAPLGIKVALASDAFCISALRAGLEACGLSEATPVVELPPGADGRQFHGRFWRPLIRHGFSPTHLLALERAGPGHTAPSIASPPNRPDAGHVFEAE